MKEFSDGTYSPDSVLAMSFMMGMAVEHHLAGGPSPVKCIMNDPATILFFSDGQKVVSKAHGGDTYDPLFGIMACALRKTSNNRERIDNWEVVIAFLSCFLADAKECRVIADMLNTTADTLELDGVGDQVIGCDVSDSAFEKALYENEVW